MFAGTLKHDPATTPHTMTAAEKAINDQIRQNRQMYATIARSAGVTYRSGSKTCFDHNRREVVLGVGQLVKLGITDPKLVDFLVLHELGHFKDLREDPRGYRQIIGEGTRADGWGPVYFEFYNSLMDIYVNRNTRNLAQQYAGPHSGYSDDVKGLYQNYAFKQQDFTVLPFCLQYSYFLLNSAMGAGDNIQLSPAVRSAIDEGVNFMGKLYSYHDFIEAFLVPVIDPSQKKGWTASIGQRKTVIDLTLRPVFEKLLQDDIAAKRSFDNQGISNFDGIEPSPEDLKKAIEQRIEELDRDAMTPEQRAQSAQHSQATNAATSAGLKAEEAGGFADTLVRVRPIVHELSEIFKLVSRKAITYSTKMQEHQRMGDTLNVDEAIQQLGVILTTPHNARVMSKATYQEVVQPVQQEIRLWLLLDLSGSMLKEMTIVQEIAVAFGATMAQLQTESQMKVSAIKGTTSMIGFSDSATDVVPLCSAMTMEQLARGFSKIVVAGGTNDHLALEQCLRELEAQPRSVEAINLVIEITDGDTSDVSSSKKAVSKLRAAGATLMAFFIEGSSTGDNFRTVWQSPEMPCGFRVSSAREITPFLRGLLLKLFGEK